MEGAKERRVQPTTSFTSTSYLSRYTGATLHAARDLEFQQPQALCFDLFVPELLLAVASELIQRLKHPELIPTMSLLTNVVGFSLFGLAARFGQLAIQKRNIFDSQ